jgi:hypothetical protein
MLAKVGGVRVGGEVSPLTCGMYVQNFVQMARRIVHNKEECTLDKDQGETIPQ